jgi:hypothetical protein
VSAGSPAPKRAVPASLAASPASLAGAGDSSERRRGGLYWYWMYNGTGHSFRTWAGVIIGLSFL